MPEGTAPALLFFERQRLSRFWLLVPIVPLVVAFVAMTAGGAALETGEVVALAVIAALVIAIGGLLAAFASISKSAATSYTCACVHSSGER